ncbi:MAG TPA: ABC transporter substrate-binding protein, partial [Thermoplasmata archaeon]|nr:ABC transporter substrate-binding protein [Thermoplasmata archaeon]
MNKKWLSSNTLHAVIIVFVMVAASFVLLVQTNVVSAQASDTQLVVGLQNPAVSLNFFDVATNSVWKAYMLEYNFESLYTYDPDSKLYSDLASDQAIPAANCPSVASIPGPYNGMCHSADFLNFTVFLHTGITFTDGQALSADDVVFSYQTLPWSTNAQVIYPALWWPQPMVPLWNATTPGCTAPASLPYACMSHTAVKKLSATSVNFQLLPVYTGTGANAVKGAYALFFYATMVVPIIPLHIWQNHMMPNALNNWSAGASGNVVDTWDRGINTAFTPYTCAQAGLSEGCSNPYIETIGTGPFYLDTYVQAAQTVIKVYPNYWGKAYSHTWNNVA